MTGIKGLLQSKKFWMTVAGAVIVSVGGQLGLSPDTLAMVAGLFGVNVAGQALADVGKSKQIEVNKLKAEAKSAPDLARKLAEA